MAGLHNGQSPSKIWYAYQRTKGVFKSMTDKTYGRDAKVMAVQSGTSAACLGAAYLLAGVSTFLFFIPVVGAVGAGGFFGYQAYKSGKTVTRSPVVTNHMRLAERAWVEKKSKPSAFSRSVAALKRAYGATGATVMTVCKWASTATAVTAGIALGVVGAEFFSAGLIPPAITTAVVGAVTTTGATLGLGATAALWGAGAALALAIPAAVGVGALCRMAATKLSTVATTKAATPKRPVLKSRLDDTPSTLGNTPSPAAEFNAPRPQSAESVAAAAERAARRDAAKKRSASKSGF